MNSAVHKFHRMINFSKCWQIWGLFSFSVFLRSCSNRMTTSSFKHHNSGFSPPGCSSCLPTFRRQMFQSWSFIAQSKVLMKVLLLLFLFANQCFGLSSPMTSRTHEELNSDQNDDLPITTSSLLSSSSSPSSSPLYLNLSHHRLIHDDNSTEDFLDNRHLTQEEHNFTESQNVSNFSRTSLLHNNTSSNITAHNDSTHQRINHVQLVRAGILILAIGILIFSTCYITLRASSFDGGA